MPSPALPSLTSVQLARLQPEIRSGRCLQGWPPHRLQARVSGRLSPYYYLTPACDRRVGPAVTSPHPDMQVPGPHRAGTPVPVSSGVSFALCTHRHGGVVLGQRGGTLRAVLHPHSPCTFCLGVVAADTTAIPNLAGHTSDLAGPKHRLCGSRSCPDLTHLVVPALPLAALQGPGPTSGVLVARRRRLPRGALPGVQ